MWNEPTFAELEKMPDINKTATVSHKQKLMHMHFSLGQQDWYFCEYSPKHKVFFGVNFGEQIKSTWGLVELTELCDMRDIYRNHADRDLAFTPTIAVGIEKIRDACGWEKPGDVSEASKSLSELLEEYFNWKFSVKVISNTPEVSWENGPTGERVRDFCDKYSGSIVITFRHITPTYYLMIMDKVCAMKKIDIPGHKIVPSMSGKYECVELEDPELMRAISGELMVSDLRL